MSESDSPELNKSPWINNAVIYQLMVDRFALSNDEDISSAPWNTPEFCGGNLRGIIRHFDHFVNLGVDAIWLSPFTKTSAYHGYHVTDFFAVDEHFGTEDDLRELTALAHSHDIKVIMDYVPNHTSLKHPYFIDAKDNPESEYRDWYYFGKKYPFGYNTFLDVPDLPKLNLENSEARRYVVDAAKHWLDCGIDAFRLDHALGPSTDFWIDFSEQMREHSPDVVLIGEAWMMGVYWAHIPTFLFKHKYAIILAGYLGIPRTKLVMKLYQGIFDGVLDFEASRRLRTYYRDNSEGDDEKLREEVISHYKDFQDDYLLPVFLDNHDMNRFSYFTKTDKKTLKRAAELMMSLPQPVVIYYGTEAGISQEHGQRDFREHGDLQMRKMMPWNNLDQELIAFFKEAIAVRKGR